MDNPNETRDFAAGIEGFVAGQLAAWEVPGCAVAAVRDGEVVLASGWGRRDLETGLPGVPPFELQPGRGLRFGVKGQPGVTAEFELDDSGAVARLLVQPLGIFRPKKGDGA